MIKSQSINYLVIADDSIRSKLLSKIDDEHYIISTIYQLSLDSEKNGTYTIQLYKSDDLINWTFITNIYSANYNIEEIYILYDE